MFHNSKWKIYTNSKQISPLNIKALQTLKKGTVHFQLTSPKTTSEISDPSVIKKITSDDTKEIQKETERLGHFF